MNTLATCGGTRLLSGDATSFTISANTPTPLDLLQLQQHGPNARSF